MDTIFYIFGFLLFLMRLPIIYKWKSIFKRTIYINKWKGVTKKEYQFSAEKDIPLTISAFLMGLMVLWSVIGLMSSNWFLFSIILGLSLLISILHSITGKIIKNYTDSNLKFILAFSLIFINTGLGFLIVLNHFHLNINFLELIQNYLQ